MRPAELSLLGSTGCGVCVLMCNVDNAKYPPLIMMWLGAFIARHRRPRSLHSSSALAVLGPLAFPQTAGAGPSRWGREARGLVVSVMYFWYVHLAGGLWHIALGAGKAGSPQMHIPRASAKRAGAAAATRHKGWVRSVNFIVGFL